MGINQFQTVGAPGPTRPSRPCSPSSPATTSSPTRWSRAASPTPSSAPPTSPCWPGSTCPTRPCNPWPRAPAATALQRPRWPRTIPHRGGPLALVDLSTSGTSLETGGHRCLRRPVLGRAQPGPRPGRRGGRSHPGLPRRRLERPLPGRRAAQLRGHCRTSTTVDRRRPPCRRPAGHPRYQLMMGPWMHVTTGTGINLSAVELEWFDTWLLGQNTPLATPPTPLHLKSSTRPSGSTTPTWPLPAAPATAFYFGAGRSGSDAALHQRRHADHDRPADRADRRGRPVAYDGVSSPCDVQTDQWGAGFLALALALVPGTTNPCDTNDVTLGHRARCPDLHHGAVRPARGGRVARSTPRLRRLHHHRHRAGGHRSRRSRQPAQSHAAHLGRPPGLPAGPERRSRPGWRPMASPSCPSTR
jgi:hypothetical protein